VHLPVDDATRIAALRKGRTQQAAAAEVAFTAAARPEIVEVELR